MAITLVIYDVVEIYKKEEKLWFIPITVKYKRYLFSIQNPDSTRENVLYATIRQEGAGSILGLNEGEVVAIFPSLNEEQILKRNQKLQKLINRLEDNGYTVNYSQLARFMSRSTDQLILGSKKPGRSG